MSLSKAHINNDPYTELYHLCFAVPNSGSYFNSVFNDKYYSFTLMVSFSLRTHLFKKQITFNFYILIIHMWNFKFSLSPCPSDPSLHAKCPIPLSDTSLACKDTRDWWCKQICTYITWGCLQGQNRDFKFYIGFKNTISGVVSILLHLQYKCRQELEAEGFNEAWSNIKE